MPRRLPVDLIGICQEVGVGLRVQSTGDARRGALMRNGKGWEIVLMRRQATPAAISAHERFTIAHELGHYILLCHKHPAPRRDAEYWRDEELCNQFASELLIPPAVLDGIPEPASAAELANIVNAVAKTALVSAEPAARAVVGTLKTPIALGSFRVDPWPSTKRLGFRGWWAESRSWWGGRGGRRLAIYADHALAPVLENMRMMRPGQIASPALGGASATLLRRHAGAQASFAALLA